MPPPYRKQIALMNYVGNVNHYWICALSSNETYLWQKGSLDSEAKALGISGWIIPIEVNRSGEIKAPTRERRQDQLLFAPFLSFREEQSPLSEQTLSTNLRNLWQYHEPLKLWGKPFIVIEGFKNLSHPYFALKRLRHAAKGLQIFSRDSFDIIELMKLGFDGQIQGKYPSEKRKNISYLHNLKQAHYNMEASGCWIPAVRALAKGEEHSWHNASRTSYQEWLQQATAWSDIRYLNKEHSPVWIDGWEGHQRWWELQSHLPTTKPKHITFPSNESDQMIQWGERKSDNIALIIHGYYLNQLEDILKKVSSKKDSRPSAPIDLYISTTIEQLPDAVRIVEEQGWPNVYIIGTRNRGRDIAPFLLKILPEVIKKQHKLFIKLHTKNSPQLDSGKEWGDYLVSTLLHPNCIQNLNEILQDPNLGFIAPKGSILPSSVEIRQNSNHLARLLKEHGMGGQVVLQENFIAGSMMAGKVEALKPATKFVKNLEDFEPEEGQTDGTLAHALERLITWAAVCRGFKVKSLENVAAKKEQGYGYKWIN